jgi:hypothetical protein
MEERRRRTFRPKTEGLELEIQRFPVCDSGKIILIAPAWPRQAWFPEVLLLSCARPLKPPYRRDLLSQFKGKVVHPRPEQRDLHEEDPTAEQLSRTLLAVVPTLCWLDCVSETDNLPVHWRSLEYVWLPPVPDPLAFAVDAMSLSWDGMFAYAFPPFRFLLQVLLKIKQSDCKIILIAPAWPKQAWFPPISRPLHQSQKIAHLASHTIPVDCLTDFEMCEVVPSEKPFWRSPSLRVAKLEDEETMALDLLHFPWTETEDLVWKEVLCISLSFAVHAMSLSWDEMFAYAFPRLRFLLQVLLKIKQSDCKIILIVPAWPKQAWFPETGRKEIYMRTIPPQNNWVEHYLP